MMFFSGLLSLLSLAGLGLWLWMVIDAVRRQAWAYPSGHSKTVWLFALFGSLFLYFLSPFVAIAYYLMVYKPMASGSTGQTAPTGWQSGPTPPAPPGPGSIPTMSVPPAPAPPSAFAPPPAPAAPVPPSPVAPAPPAPPALPATPFESAGGDG